MKIIAYLISKEEDNQQQVIDIHKQKMAVFDYCKKNNCELTECKIENIENKSQDFPVLFSILAQNHLYERILFYKKDIFDDNKEFHDWLFNELKSKKINFDFALKSEEEEKEDDIKIKKEQLIQKAKNVPALPHTVIKALQLIQNDKSSAWQLAKIMKYDTGLTGKILQLVNSTFYGFPKQISSIQHGITILGFNTIKGLVISSNIYKTFRPTQSADTFDYNKFWLHTTLCATIANEFIKHINCSVEEKEEIFSSSILHDIGKLILNQYDAANYKNVLQNQSNPLDVVFNIKLEEKFCTLAHTDIGAVVTESWNLPEVISQACAYHHTPLSSKKEYVKTLCIVSVSNTLANIILNNNELTKDFFEQEILDTAHIKYDTIVNVFGEFKENPERISDLKSFYE